MRNQQKQNKRHKRANMVEVSYIETPKLSLPCGSENGDLLVKYLGMGQKNPWSWGRFGTVVLSTKNSFYRSAPQNSETTRMQFTKPARLPALEAGGRRGARGDRRREGTGDGTAQTQRPGVRPSPLSGKLISLMRQRRGSLSMWVGQQLSGPVCEAPKYVSGNPNPIWGELHEDYAVPCGLFTKNGSLTSSELVHPDCCYFLLLRVWGFRSKFSYIYVWNFAIQFAKREKEKGGRKKANRPQDTAT